MTSTNHTPRLTPFAALSVALALLLPAAAAAQDAHPCATLSEAPFNNYERLEREGVDAYKAKRYADAIKSFETARTLCDRSQSLIFALGRSYHLSGDCLKASTFYRQALQLEGKKLDDISNRLTEAESECATRPGTLEVACTQPGVSVSVNGASPSPCPLTVDLPPGPVSVYATLDGHQPHTAQARVESNASTPVRIPALSPTPADTPPDLPPLTPPPSKALVISGWTTAGVGVALLGVGAGMLSSAGSTRDEVTSTLRSAGIQPVTALTRQEALSKQSDADSTATTGAILLGVGGAAIATSAILLILHYTADAPPASPSVGLTPTLGPNQVGLSLSATF